jgi:hypothetical protein
METPITQAIYVNGCYRDTPLLANNLLIEK